MLHQHRLQARLCRLRPPMLLARSRHPKPGRVGLTFHLVSLYKVVSRRSQVKSTPGIRIETYFQKVTYWDLNPGVSTFAMLFSVTFCLFQRKSQHFFCHLTPFPYPDYLSLPFMGILPVFLDKIVKYLIFIERGKSVTSFLYHDILHDSFLKSTFLALF